MSQQNAGAIAFIDPTVSDYQNLIQGITPNTTVILLDPNRNGIEQITEVIIKGNYSNVHIVSHGNSGSLQIGKTLLNLQSLETYRPLLSQWAKALTDDAEILLYGCNVASDLQGEQFVKQLSKITGKDIAASTDLTGNADLGGDWELEYSTGKIETDLAFQEPTRKAYIGVLDTTYHNLAAGNFSQNWSNKDLITANNNWSGVPSIIGYRGDGLANGVAIDPQTILADGSATPVNVFANQKNPNGFLNGGVAEFDISNPVVALQGSGTASAPHIVLHLNTTGQQGVRVKYKLRDIDASSDNAIQPVALQYRVGNTGNFINLPTGFVPDMTAPVHNSGMTREADINVVLPAAANNQSQVQVRIITTDANSFDEWVGIDDIEVTSTSIASNQLATAVNDTYTVIENGSLTTAPAVTSLILDSDQGNYVGQGDYYPFSLASGNFSAKRNFDNSVSISYTEPGSGGHWWYLDFAAPNNAQLTPGTYTGATRAGFHAPTEPGLDVSGDGRGYNELNGQFTINQVVYGSGDEIISFDATFQEYGDGDPISESFRGRVQYRATKNNLLPGVLTNDTDAENKDLTAFLVTGPANGSLTFNKDGSFTYTPKAGFTGIDTFTYVANDSIADSTPATVTINVVGENKPPVNSVPQSHTTKEDTPLTFTDKNTISISDGDAGTKAIRTTLNIPIGQLNITPQGGLTISGNGSNNVQLDGTIDAINAGLKTLVYNPLADFNGTTTLKVTTDDLGNSGTGGAKTDIDEVKIDILPVNDAPDFQPGSDQSVNAGDGDRTVTAWATGFYSGADNESNQTIQGYYIVSNSDPDIFAKTPEIDKEGKLTYTPVASIASSKTATIGVTVRDSGGTENGGKDTSEIKYFTITVNPANLPEIEVSEGNINIVDGTTSPIEFGNKTVGDTPVTKTFTINNTGKAFLKLGTPTLPNGFSLVSSPAAEIGPEKSTSFTVQLNTSEVGDYKGDVSFSNDDADENPFNFAISGKVVVPSAPEIEVFEGNNNIADGTTSPIDFGSKTVGDSPVTKTFTINNKGTDSLSFGSFNLPSGFSLLTPLPPKITAGNSVNFTVQLNTAEAGNYKGEISFANNDDDESPFNFAIAGTVNPKTPPEIEVLQGTTNIADGSNSPIDFGSVLIGGTPISRSFTVKNTGGTSLKLENVNLPAGFSLVAKLPNAIAPGNSADFTVQLDTSKLGNYSGEISFSNNDSDENPFNFAISGKVTETPPPETPEIEVFDNVNNIIDGTISPINFGTTNVGTSLTKTFTIKNTGKAGLNLSNLNLPSGFSVLGKLPENIAAGESADVKIQLDANAADTYAGTLKFDNNDGDENPFDFAITGTVDLLENPPKEEEKPLDIDCFCQKVTHPNPLEIEKDFTPPNSIEITQNGTENDDVMFWDDRHHALIGFGGKDTLHGSHKNDIIFGGSNDIAKENQNEGDLIFANQGDDWINGNEGEDTLRGGKGEDFLRGGKNDDLIWGDIGDDMVMGDKGNDTIFGGTDLETPDENGKDLLFGLDGDDVINGNQGNDTVCGNEGNDTVRGGQNDDIIFGEAGDDELYGDMGNDSLCAGEGNDTIYGGIGNKTPVGAAGEKDCLCGGKGDDLLFGNEGEDQLCGKEGDDTLCGGKDNDTLAGGVGDDWLSGDKGNDTLMGGEGRDRFFLNTENGTDTIIDFEDNLDKLVLAENLTYSQLKLTSVNGNTKISFAETGEVLAIILKTETSLITQGDFVYSF